MSEHENASWAQVPCISLLADMVAFIESQPCLCEPLFDDQPDGAQFGPPCDRCNLLDRYYDAVNDGTIDPANPAVTFAPLAARKVDELVGHPNSNKQED